MKKLHDNLFHLRIKELYQSEYMKSVVMVIFVLMPDINNVNFF